MRSRGWAGSTPSSDEEAVSRILSAVDEEVAENGAAIRLADVARRLGVTRQTVYRYFPNADALLMASGMRAVNGFIDQVTQHVSGLKDPVAVEQTVIEYTDACFFFIKKGAVDINLSCQKILTSMVWT